VGNIIRRLTSNQDGEVEATAHALVRVLKSAGNDTIHELAERIEKSGFTQAEMQKLFNAGYDAGVRAAEAKLHGGDDFHDIGGKPTPEGMTLYCQQRGNRLSEREREFIDGLAGRVVYREPSEKQLKWLVSIYRRLGGGPP
jgi:hypothetical protein